MKRSEMVEHMAAELEEMIQNLVVRPGTRPYITDKWANRILDMQEGLGMRPPFNRDLDPWGEKGMSVSLCEWEEE